ncbi:MAG: type II toxin-antitoxin system Phd/YefM family antitoxin [Thermoanaerobaculia bacterium]
MTCGPCWIASSITSFSPGWGLPDRKSPPPRAATQGRPYKERRRCLMRAWTIQETQDRLSEVVEDAIQHGPQVILRSGAEVAVVLSYEEYLALKKGRTNLAQFFLESPLRDSGLDLRRDRSVFCPVRGEGM